MSKECFAFSKEYFLQPGLHFSSWLRFPVLFDSCRLCDYVTWCYMLLYSWENVIHKDVLELSMGRVNPGASWVGSLFLDRHIGSDQIQNIETW